MLPPLFALCTIPLCVNQLSGLEAIATQLRDGRRIGDTTTIDSFARHSIGDWLGGVLPPLFALCTIPLCVKQLSGLEAFATQDWGYNDN